MSTRKLTVTTKDVVTQDDRIQPRAFESNYGLP